MKKFYLLIAVLITAIINLGNVQAATDVTSTYLTNAGFNSNCNYLVATAAENLGSANAGANIKTVEGWTKGTTGDNSAAASFEYGYAGTLNLSNVTYGFIPSQSYTSTSGANEGCLGISVAWSGTVTYYQNVTLPAGKYTIEYAAYNSGPATADICKLGWVPTSGTSALSALTTFTMGAWTTESINFTLAAETSGIIQVGLTAPNAGSGSTGRIFFDYVKLLLNDVDKTTLGNLIATANGMIASPEPVGASTAYTDLSNVVTAAQTVYDNALATALEVITQENALTAAIAAVNSAIVIEQRASTWTTLPYDVTSVIKNPSFETGTSADWTNVGPFVPQTNTSFPYKQGTYYFEKWKSSGNWTGLKISQIIKDLPNGIYKLTAGALNSPNTTGGAFVFANAEKVEVFAPNDYTLLVTVTNNQLEIGYEVVNGGNYVATDNYRLSYISDGSPYVVLDPTSLFFAPNILVKTFTVSGGNLTENLVLSAPSGISLDITSLTPAEVAAGATITATFDNATSITDGSITATSGSLSQSITVNTSADLNCFTPYYPELTNMVSDPYMNSLATFGGWGNKSITTDPALVYCGKGSGFINGTALCWPNSGSIDANIAWQPNKTYIIRAMVKAPNGTFNLGVSNETDITGTKDFVIPQSETWTQFSQIITTGANATSGLCFFNGCGASTSYVGYIDNWEIYDITSVSTGTNAVNADMCSTFVRDNSIVVKLNLAMSGEVEFALYNVNGMLISSQKSVCVNGISEKVLNANLQNGIYFVKVTTAGKSVTQKVVK